MGIAMLKTHSKYKQKQANDFLSNSIYWYIKTYADDILRLHEEVTSNTDCEGTEDAYITGEHFHIRDGLTVTYEVSFTQKGMVRLRSTIRVDDSLQPLGDNIFLDIHTNFPTLTSVAPYLKEHEDERLPNKGMDLQVREDMNDIIGRIYAQMMLKLYM